MAHDTQKIAHHWGDARWTEERAFIPWSPAFPYALLPLGRNIRFDSRSLAEFRHARQYDAAQLASVAHERMVPILNQGEAGSCTGNAGTGDLGSDPCYLKLPTGHPGLDEQFAVGLYSAAEDIDGDGPYPPNDNGSCGLSVAQALKAMGMIAGYTHCADAGDIADALQDYCVLFGSNWYDSMDAPDSSGMVTVSPNASLRGGHEFVGRVIDVDRKLVGCDNSWGTGWGVDIPGGPSAGSFWMTWDTAERLLGEQGDAVVLIPLGMPVPRVGG